MRWQNIMRKFLFLALMVMLASYVSAGYVFDKAVVTDTMDTEMSIQETINITISDNTLKSFLFTFPQAAYQISANDVQLENQSASIPLNCSICKIELSYRLDQAATAVDLHTNAFSRTIHFPSSPKVLNYSVHLPSGYVIDTNSTDPAMVPEPTGIDTDGKSIIINWLEKQPELPKQYYVRYMDSEQSTVGLSGLIHELKESSVWLIAAVTLIIGLAVGMFFSRRKSKPKAQREHETVPSSLLSPDERAIVEFLQKSDEPLTQKEIGKALDWSKSKVSGVMTNLQYKKIVERERIGRNFKVTLVKRMD
jgi:uncharacterized membrane protein